MHGQGTYTWPDGGTYIGSWLEGKRQGQGTFKDANGNVYVGEY